MIECYHLLARALDGSVLAEWHQGRWLLPFCQLPKHVRPAHAVTTAATRLGLSGFLGGLVRGLVSDDGSRTDWLAVWWCSDHQRPQPSPWSRWENPERLPSNAALCDVQPALLASPPDATIVVSSAQWLGAVHEWVESSLRLALGGDWHIAGSECLRASAQRAVIAFEMTPKATVFFRATTMRSLSEARLARWFATKAGGRSAPRTLALDEGRGWWLCAEAEGHPFESGASLAEHVEVARALARLQIATRDHVGELQRVGLPIISWQQVDAQLQALLASLDDQPMASTNRGTAVDLYQRTVSDICRTLDALALPVTWVDTDLFYGNIFLRPGGLHIVDLEKSVLTFPHVALETLLANIARTSPDSSCVAPALRSVFRDEWSSILPAIEHERIELYAPIASRMLRLVVRSEQTTQKAARGELVAPLGFLRNAAARAFIQHLDTWLAERARRPRDRLIAMRM